MTPVSGLSQFEFAHELIVTCAVRQPEHYRIYYLILSSLMMRKIGWHSVPRCL